MSKQKINNVVLPVIPALADGDFSAMLVKINPEKRTRYFKLNPSGVINLFVDIADAIIK